MRTNRSNKVLNKTLENDTEFKIIKKIFNNYVKYTDIVIESLEEGDINYIIRYMVEGKYHKVKQIYKDNIEEGVKTLLESFNCYMYSKPIINLSLLSYRAIRTLEWLVDDIYYKGGALIDFTNFTLENHVFIYQCLTLFEKMELLQILEGELPIIEVKFLYKREDILFNIYETLKFNKCSL